MCECGVAQTVSADLEIKNVCSISAYAMDAGLHAYRLWRRWLLFRLYGPPYREPNFLLLPPGPATFFDRSPPILLYWYFWISGVSRSEFWLITKSSVCVSIAFSLASIALIVNSLLILVDIEVRTANAGISTLDFALSNSSCVEKRTHKNYEKHFSPETFAKPFMGNSLNSALRT